MQVIRAARSGLGALGMGRLGLPPIKRLNGSFWLASAGAAVCAIALGTAAVVLIRGHDQPQSSLSARHEAATPTGATALAAPITPADASRDATNQPNGQAAPPAQPPSRVRAPSAAHRASRPAPARLAVTDVRHRAPSHRAAAPLPPRRDVTHSLALDRRETLARQIASDQKILEERPGRLAKALRLHADKPVVRIRTARAGRRAPVGRRIVVTHRTMLPHRRRVAAAWSSRRF
jgi:hypothetical protein